MVQAAHWLVQAWFQGGRCALVVVLLLPHPVLRLSFTLLVECNIRTPRKWGISVQLRASLYSSGHLCNLLACTWTHRVHDEWWGEWVSWQWYSPSLVEWSVVWPPHLCSRDVACDVAWRDWDVCSWYSRSAKSKVGTIARSSSVYSPALHLM